MREGGGRCWCRDGGLCADGGKSSSGIKANWFSASSVSILTRLLNAGRDSDSSTSTPVNPPQPEAWHGPILQREASFPGNLHGQYLIQKWKICGAKNRELFICVFNGCKSKSVTVTVELTSVYSSWYQQWEVDINCVATLQKDWSENENNCRSSNDVWHFWSDRRLRLVW